MYHAMSEKIVDILASRTGGEDRHFFRVMTAYYMSLIASMMRTDIKTHDRGIIPVNLYAVALGTSGAGKTYSMNILEELMVDPFKDDFIDEVFNVNATKHLNNLANKLANSIGEDPSKMLENLVIDYENLGPLAFTFDSATSAAIKQLRRKLLMAKTGSLNLIIDEIGSSLTTNMEALTDYLSLYDKGLIKQKITKSTSENKRGVEVTGVSPANLLMFGTPSKLLNASATEEAFDDLLRTGYARRLIYAYNTKPRKADTRSPEEVYAAITNPTLVNATDEIVEWFNELADMDYYNVQLTMDKSTSLKLIQYRLECEKKAEAIPEHREAVKAEMMHRYYKTLKLAGAYAFVDKSSTITDYHLDCAIQVVEDSGEAFTDIMHREKPYVKLAKYLANVEHPVTHTDLMEDLPFYSGSESKRRELMALAVAYGYKNNIVVTKTFESTVEFFKGESLKETDLSNLIVSYSDHITEGYTCTTASWDKLVNLVTADNMHYVAHHLKDGYRSADKVIPGFNLLILDVDSDVSLDTAKLLLQDYTYLMATTKRHTDKANRFRIILPMSHILKLNPEQYKQFMSNVFDWLPFKVDEATSDIARKWATHNGEYFYNEGTVIDATLFIPKTKKAEEQVNFINEHSTLTNLERWFVTQASEGSRNNTVIKYAYALVDKGYDLDVIRASIIEFNNKLDKPLTRTELDTTIMVSVTKKYTEKHH